jgi:hypothetical protein
VPAKLISLALAIALLAVFAAACETTAPATKVESRRKTTAAADVHQRHAR